MPNQHAEFHSERRSRHQHDNAEADFLKGAALHKKGRLGDAESCYQSAIARRYDHASARLRLAAVYDVTERQHEAISLLQETIKIRPKDHRGYVGLSKLLLKYKRHPDAKNVLREALNYSFGSAACHILLSGLYAREQDYSLAEHHGRIAKSIDSGSPEARASLGYALHCSGKDKSAMFEYLDALKIDTKNISARINLGLLLLRNNCLAEGFDLFGPLYRSKEPNTFSSIFSLASKLRYWTSGPIDHQPIIVWGDQGLGDQILFAGMIPELAAIAGPITLIVDKRLCPVFKRSLPNIAVTHSENAPKIVADAKPGTRHICLSDLGRHLRRRLPSKPQTRYLQSDPHKVAAFRAKHETLAQGRRIVGISWNSEAQVGGPQKSIPLEHWLPILRDNKFFFVSLQYGVAHQHVDRLNSKHGLNIYHDQEVNPKLAVDAHFAQTAATDSVITISNSLAHIAASQGVETHLLLPPGAGSPWYWFTETPSSPWYSSVQILRSQRGSTANTLWRTDVMSAVKDKLAD
jgi:Flp pilus assembly protein TadD/ADP-heptose:LPS heptosyltransferase